MGIQVNGCAGDDVQGGDNPWKAGERNVDLYVSIYIECTHIHRNTQANAFDKKAGRPSLHLLRQII